MKRQTWSPGCVTRDQPPGDQMRQTELGVGRRRRKTKPYGQELESWEWRVSSLSHFTVFSNPCLTSPHPLLQYTLVLQPHPAFLSSAPPPPPPFSCLPSAQTPTLNY
ncbi:hypothetical protein Pmani_038372 [Petrolisthes manimaculis]|uniref:Uncharacterized protein n=1 Tax=Petrolisthes manimaculis TaxID=1843537 RepID=A0AAE1TMC6_9EUCA|nr:hypothetical protein Pmani_038372 [Petrolisthes manimaculis]